MFHIGKVLEVMRPSEKGSKGSDGSTHALVEMWDDNLLIFRAHPLVAGELKDGCFVLVDYTPVAVGGAAVPRQEISSVVGEAKAKKVMARLRSSFEQKKPKAQHGEQGFFPPGKMIG